MKLNANVEVSIRMDFGVKSSFYTDNSISGVKREYIDVEEAKRWNLTRD